MKPYTYTVYKYGEQPVEKLVTEPGGPAPANPPIREYKSLAEQAQIEGWDLRDSSILEPSHLRAGYLKMIENKA